MDAPFIAMLGTLTGVALLTFMGFREKRKEERQAKKEAAKTSGVNEKTDR